MDTRFDAIRLNERFRCPAGTPAHLSQYLFQKTDEESAIIVGSSDSESTTPARMERRRFLPTDKVIVQVH